MFYDWAWVPPEIPAGLDLSPENRRAWDYSLAQRRAVEVYVRRTRLDPNRPKVGAVESDRPSLVIGYNEHRTNLPGGRQANVSTNRAMVVKADGAERRSVGGELANEAGAWTQFAGWSPDGRTAVVLRGWESVENAQWEEEHKTFRFTPEGWLVEPSSATTAMALSSTSIVFRRSSKTARPKNASPK